MLGLIFDALKYDTDNVGLRKKNIYYNLFNTYWFLCGRIIFENFHSRMDNHS